MGYLHQLPVQVSSWRKERAHKGPETFHQVFTPECTNISKCIRELDENRIKELFPRDRSS